MSLVEIKLPELGEGVHEGELVKWLVKPGDSVKMDQPVVEMMTDKATVEIPSNTSGVVKELKVKEGDMVKVETVILVLESGASASAPAPAAKAAAAPTPAPAAKLAATPAVSAPAATSAAVMPPVAASHVLATPSTRKLARDMNIDINNLSGSGLAGRVTREDVLSTSGAGSSSSASASSTSNISIPRPSYQGPAGSAEERVPLRGIRRKIAENMQMYKHIIPHFSLMDEVNVTKLVKMRESMKEQMEKSGIKITYLPFVMKAIIAAAREFPMVNASIDDAAGEIVYKKYFNIGFAADTPNGLVVPVIKNADQKTILEISQEIVALAKKARDGKLTMDEMKGATVTITNIGSIGGTYATPIINHPEVAIFGMYKIYDKPVLVNNKWRAHKIMNVSVTADHRLIDGAVAARFMNAVNSRLENPARLMLDMV